MTTAKERIGVWLIGGRGGVAITTMVGLAALRKGLTATNGLVTALPEFKHLPFLAWDQIIVGGHDVRDIPLQVGAQELVEKSRALSGELLRQVRSDLVRVEKNMRPGILFNVGDTIRQLATPELKSTQEKPPAGIERVQHDWQDFAKREKLDRLIVVNLASTEPRLAEDKLPKRWRELRKTIHSAKACPLGASSLYAIAAFESGHSYINFTPSTGASPDAIQELAMDRGCCHVGQDGKTGETLLKSVLAPMFARRNLEVMSWVGHNIFGNMDGQVLNDPANKATKVVSKDRLLAEILGYAPQTLVSIEYIQSLGDWKTAWDHIHFRGFLDTPMVLQFCWQGCDSLLAAPLVLDLIRFTALARATGSTGVLTFLSSFFKSPLGVRQHDFAKQFDMLTEWVHSHS
ncbi:MAG: inositol-3-phosphate synthase [Planctomycetota bacterium]|nr:inositol-3-phosphate synthase [Planctomycetota bacterium]MDA1178488.1 inositol-3-phosphate synthase [Planctomycetota bacterium]